MFKIKDDTLIIMYSQFKLISKGWLLCFLKTLHIYD
jgi:hypothetical protein